MPDKEGNEGEFEDISLAGVSVMIGMPVDNPIPHKTALSLAETMYVAGARGISLALQMEISGIIQDGRNAVFTDFLNSKANKLFWIDSDMVWEVDDFLKMLALSTKKEVICSAYSAKISTTPTFQMDYDLPFKVEDYGLISVKGLGLGFSIIDREVCEKLAAQSPRYISHERELVDLFRVDIADGHRRTEDMAFFSDIRDLGYKVWVDPSIELGHIGELEWRGRLSDAINKGKE
jgi:hypothetical protein